MSYRKQLVIRTSIGVGLAGIILLCLTAVKSTHHSDLLTQRWSHPINGIGVGSPTVIDLNNDSIQDIVIGTGFEWSPKGASSLTAIDGKTGKIIWVYSMPESVYGTPAMVDITGDGIDDITVTGRFNTVEMINGKTGRRIWSLNEQNPTREFLPCNFNSPVIADDFNFDGFPELILIQGGLSNDSNYLTVQHVDTGFEVITTYNKQAVLKNIRTLLARVSAEKLRLNVCMGTRCVIKTVSRRALMNQPFDQIMQAISLNQEGPGSKIMVVSSKTGQLLAQYSVPFSRESWSVPIYLKINHQPIIIYGSGGERMAGHMIAQNIITGKVLWAIPSESKGFISSPILIRDHQQVPVAYFSGMDGTVTAVNVQTGLVVWKTDIGSEYETYSSLAARERNGETSLVGVFSRGVWPTYDKAIVVELNARSGEVLEETIIGFCHAASSPVIADIDHNNSDDIVMISCTDRDARLLVLDSNHQFILEKPLESGGYSTPLIMDIDQNNALDIILSRFHFLDRYEQSQPSEKIQALPWNRYRGTKQNGHYN